MPKIKIHSSNLIYLTICLAGIAAFVLMGIYPNARSMDEIEYTIAELDQKVQAQELLQPIYRQLLKEIQIKAPNNLPLPPKTEITRNNMAQITTIFSKLALENDLSFESATPDPSSYLEETRHLIMNVAFSGDFFNFRKLIVQICSLPYLESIDRLQIKASNDKKWVEMKLKLTQE